MKEGMFSRRRFLQLCATAAGGALVAACAPKVVEKVVEKEVTKVVKETVIVEKVVEAPAKVEEEFALEVYTPFNAPFASYVDLTIVPQLGEKFPGAKVYLRPLNWGRMEEMLLISKAAGAMPDIFFMGASFVPIAAENELSVVLDDLLDEWGQRDDFYKAALETCQWKGKTWGLPMEVAPRVYQYRKDLSDEAGVDIPEDWTWDDFLEAAIALTVQEGNKIVRMGSIAMMDTQEWMGVLMSYGTEAKGNILRNAKAAFNSEGGVWSLNWIKERNNAIAPEGYAPLPQSVIPYMATGQMVIGYTEGSWGHRIIKYAPEKWQNIKIQQPPLKNQRIALSNCNWFALAVTCKHQDAGWELLKLTMSDKCQIIWNQPNGRLVPRRSAVADYLNDPQMVECADILMNQAVPFTMIPSWGKWNSVLQPMIESVSLGLKSAEEALAEAEKEINGQFADRPDWPDM